MSDLRTELFTKVLPKMQTLTKPTNLDNLTFDDPEQPEVPVQPGKLTNNERIFEWIKDHPACTGAEVIKAFDGEIVGSSVYSQLHNMTSRGLLHKAECSSTGYLIYSAVGDKYPRAKREGAIAKMKEGRLKLGAAEISRRISEGHIANRKPAEEPKRKVVLIKRRTPDAVATPAVQVTPVDLNSLSIVQARKLYDELKQIFGA